MSNGVFHFFEVGPEFILFLTPVDAWLQVGEVTFRDGEFLFSAVPPHGAGVVDNKLVDGPENVFLRIAEDIRQPHEVK